MPAAVGAIIEPYEDGYAYRYIDDGGQEVIERLPSQEGIVGQEIKDFNDSIGYYRVIGIPFVELELDADGARAASEPDALLEAMLAWYDELPADLFDKSFRPKIHHDIYIGKSSIGDGACVPARMVIPARSHQLIRTAKRAGQTMIALKALADGWGYGTTSNITIGNAADFRS